MKSRYFYFPLVMFALAFGSCTQDDGIPTGNTPVTLKITDAPADYDAIYLSINQIEIKTVSGRKTFDISTEPFNILKYQFGKDTTLLNESVPSGRIQEILVKFNPDGNQITVDGETYPLAVNTDEFHKVKVTINDNLEVGVAHSFLLDFDAAKSIRKNDMNEWFLKPVIRTISIEKSGNIQGIINPASARPKIYVVTGTDSIGTVTDSVGNFYIPGVNQGSYQLIVQPSALEFEAVAMPVIVTQGELTDVGTIELTAPTDSE